MPPPPAPEAQPPDAHPKSRRRRLFPHFRYSAVELLISLVALFLAAPFVDGLKGGQIIESILLSVVLVSTVLAIRARPRTLAVAVLLVTLAVAAKWLNHFHPQIVSPQMFLWPTIVVVTFVVVHLMRFILNAPRVDREVLCAGLANFLMLGLLWSLAYGLLAILSPDAFAFNTTAPDSQAMTGFTAFYYSFVVLTTLGFGDVTPISEVARMLTVMESTTGLLYIAVMIARLVALQTTSQASAHSDDS